MKFSGSISCPFCEGRGYNIRRAILEDSENKRFQKVKIWCEDCKGTGVICVMNTDGYNEGVLDIEFVSQRKTEAF